MKRFFQNTRKDRADYSQISDQDLVKQFQEQEDNTCILELMDRYADLISGLCYRYFDDQEDVKDFTSELFIKLSRQLKKLNTDEVRNFNGWLYTYIKHRILDQLRKAKTYRNYKQGYGLEVVKYEKPDEGVLQLDREKLYHSMTRLSANEKLCVELIYLQERTYQEIMKEHGFSFNQVRGFRDRGVTKLKTLLKEDFETYFKDL